MLYSHIEYVTPESEIKSEEEMVEFLKRFKSKIRSLFRSGFAPSFEELMSQTKFGIIRVPKERLYINNNLLPFDGLKIDVSRVNGLCMFYEERSERKCQNCRNFGEKPSVNETYYFCKKYETGEGLNEKYPVSPRIDNIGAENCNPFENRYIQGVSKSLSELIKLANE